MSFSSVPVSLCDATTLMKINVKQDRCPRLGHFERTHFNGAACIDLILLYIHACTIIYADATIWLNESQFIGLADGGT